MARKSTVATKRLSIPLNYYEEDEPTPEKLDFYNLVYRNILAIQHKLLMKVPFVGNVLLNLNVVLDTTLDTAATDFRNIFVNPDFWVLLDDEERMFVLAHETWHVAMNHALRRQGRDPEDWNYATDLEIAFILEHENFKEPWRLQHDPSWSTLSAEQIYEELMKHKKPRRRRGGNPGSNPGGESGDDDGKGGGTGEGGLRFPNGSSDKSNGKFGSTDKPFDSVIYDDGKPAGSDVGCDGGKKVVRKGEWKRASEVPERPGEFCRRIVQQAAIITQKQNGTVPGAITGVIEQLNNPVIPWREQLSHWASTVISNRGPSTYTRPSRRSWVHNVILPTREDKSIKIVVAFDTSGSCGPELQQFFDELMGIMNSFDTYDLTLIQCDSEIQDVKKYTNDEPYDPEEGFKAHGFGGTDFRPVFDYIEENDLNPTGLIYLTDGYGPAPDEEPDYPVLWVITQGGKRPCDWAEAVSLTDDRIE